MKGWIAKVTFEVHQQRLGACGTSCTFFGFVLGIDKCTPLNIALLLLHDGGGAWWWWS